MKKYSFSIGAEEIQIEHFMKRYHFDGKDRELIQSTGVFLAGLLTVESVVCCGQEQAVCAVTLGRNYDELESVVEKSGNLLLGYCIECFGMEFLSKAYEKINELFFGDTGKWLGTYLFLDSADGETWKTATSALKAVGISWEKGMLYPLKSVVFSAQYKDKPEKFNCHDCEKCSNLTCSFRENIHKKEKKKNTVTVSQEAVYSYGISRILRSGAKAEDSV